MRRPGGYAILSGPDLRRPNEWDTFTCFHCNAVKHLRAGDPTADSNEGCRCVVCDKLICKRCKNLSAKFGCTPFEKAIEKAEARDRFRREAGLT